MGAIVSYYIQSLLIYEGLGLWIACLNLQILITGNLLDVLMEYEKLDLTNSG
jgi:hypothetical protein